MDMTFTCPSCKQQLEADVSMAGSEIECPSCGHLLAIPDANPTNVKVNPIASSAAAKEEYHFRVPQREVAEETLIEKPNKPLEVASDGQKRIRIRCIRRTDCMEVGHDHFEEVVSDFLGRIGEESIVSITPLTYTHLDIGTQKLLTDYGVMIVYKG